MQPVIIYCHGFLSSSQANKAQVLKRYVAENKLPWHIEVPDLEVSPAVAIEQIAALIQHYKHRPVALMGSSLGGFYATHLSQTYGLPAVLLNPAVAAHQLINHYLGDNIHYHTGKVCTVTISHIEELAALYHTKVKTPEKLLVLTQTGDDVLDVKQAVTYYQACQQVITPGGDHEFQHFLDYLPVVFDWLNRQLRS